MRLRRAAKHAPLVLSSATRQGVPEALRALADAISASTGPGEAAEAGA